MTPKVEVDRLRDSRDIVAVLRGGQRRVGRFVVLHTTDRAPEPVTDGNMTGCGAQGPPSPARIAVVASRKVGTAVSRNRAKRVMREAARRVHWQPGTDAVLVARDTCASARMDSVLDELRELASDLTRTAA